MGERSSRRIERRCTEDIAFRVVAANQVPDHATIARFLASHERAVSALFCQVLWLCQRVWAYPRPPRLEATGRSLRVVFAATAIAQTARGFRVLETSHPPNCYFPPEDIVDGVLARADGTSWCEFKGRAHYFDVRAGDRVERGAA